VEALRLPQHAIDGKDNFASGAISMRGWTGVAAGVVVLISLIGSTHGCGEKVCGAVACFDRFTSQILPANGHEIYGEGTYIFRVDAGTIGTFEATCTYSGGALTLVGGLPGQGCVSDSISVYIDYGLFILTFSGSNDPAKSFKALTGLKITVAFNQAVVGEKTFTPSFARDYPNGEDCDGDYYCLIGEGTMEISL
jgi:hypothetical protein